MVISSIPLRIFYGRGGFVNIKRFAAVFLIVFFLSVFIALMVTSTARITLRTAAMPQKSMPHIVIDAGHGGEDGGAVSGDGVPEKEINLAIAQDTDDLLTFFGLDTEMTRTDDGDLSTEGDNTKQRKNSDMKKRLEIFNASSDNTVISIHQNKFSDTSSHGTQVFYSPNNEKSLLLADAIKFSVKSQLQPDNERLSKPAGSGINLLKNTTQPAVIVECGFLSNREECEKLKTGEYQRQMAFAVTTGFLDYYNTN